MKKKKAFWVTILFFTVVVLFAQETITGIFSPDNKSGDINALQFFDDSTVNILYNNRPYFRLTYKYEMKNSVITIKTIDGIIELEFIDSKQIICISGKFKDEVFFKKDE
jgi:hypothetical protein